MKFWMSEAYSVLSLGTTTSGSAAPMSWAPSLAPSNEYWLKFLSSTVPTSVTTPIFQLPPLVEGGGALGLSAAAVGEASAAVGVAAAAVGEAAAAVALAVAAAAVAVAAAV